MYKQKATGEPIKTYKDINWSDFHKWKKEREDEKEKQG